MNALVLLAVLGLVPALAQKTEDDAPVSIAVVDTDIGDAFRLVGRQCGVNMVISNEVQGTITLSLEDASLDEALEAMVNVGGLRYFRKGNTVTVQTLDELLAQRKQEDEFKKLADEPLIPDPRTLVLNLRYVDAERIQPIVQGLLSETGTVSLLQTSDHVARDRGSSGATSKSETDLQIGTTLSTNSVGEPAKSHTLVVVDFPDRIERVKQVVADIDVKPLQVVIAARFVEVSLNEDQKLGIDWNVLARSNGAAAPHTAPFGTTSLGEFDPNVEGGGAGGVFPPAPDLVTIPGEPGLFTFGTLDFTAFSAALEMIKTNTDVQMVSNPSVVVRDRHTATILVGERYPILSANVSEFGSVTEQLDHYEPIGVQLSVTPSVLGDEVELLVRPSTSSLGPDVEGSTGLGVARINSRQIDTLVTVKDGQTVMIGGLITTRETQKKTSVPFFGAIPLMGKLFQHDSTVEERVDLVVFLTVSIAQEHGLTAEQRTLFEETRLGGAAAIDENQEQTELQYVPSSPQY